jgi:hypothetical protein
MYYLSGNHLVLLPRYLTGDFLAKGIEQSQLTWLSLII